ncbi:MAG: glycosyltransferase family 39 protein [Muribaculaceae bacterium]|nr:glycosyltransferase family 39 protein [Muribaculaceae bacterium]
MSRNQNVNGKSLELGTLVFLAALAIASLLLVSPDSYLHDLYNRVDSAWYYMCGKAWMEGMTPYVDFTDSKGPLLWLIYGIGYLISPRDYTGVFWLSCLSYVATLWLVYRSALLLLGDRRWALLCAVLMPLAYFYPYIHEETKTEDFAQPFIALCLYGCLQLIYESRLRHGIIVKLLLLIGASVACVLMMKYSLVPMLGFFAILAIVAARRHKVKVLTSLGWIAAGFVVALLPWCIYFAMAGNFMAFVKEYFLATFDTLQYLRDEHGTIIDILRKFRLHNIVTLFPLLCLGGSLLHAFCFSRFRWLAPVATLWFFLCTIPNAWWLYYYNTCTWTLFFGITAVLVIMKHFTSSPSRFALATAAIAVTAAVGVWSVLIVPQNFFTIKHPARDAYYRYVYLMNQVKQPRVIYWDIYSTGFETAVGGLPACKYWAGQNGATPKMRQEQEACVKTGIADFVLVSDTSHDQQLQQWGYHRWDYSRRNDTDRCDDLLYTLYTRHTLKAPPTDFMPPTPKEILLKKWHLK